MIKPYFILPFDHRSTFTAKLMGFEYPPEPEQAERIKEMKSLVFDAFLEARHKEPALNEHQAILIDLEFGSEIVTRAKSLGIPLAVSTEQSGQDLFTFEYGDKFGEKLLEVLPTFAKALVRYDHRKTEDNKIQRHRLKQLSDFCETHKIGLMIEPLMKAEGPLVDQMETCLKELLAEGIKPTLWKLEGLDSAEEWQRIQKITDVDIIVLGRGENRKAVENWIGVAAKSGVPDGFAIGRTVFFNPLERYRDGEISREETVQLIAKNYLYFSRHWMEHRKKQRS